MADFGVIMFPTDQSITPQALGTELEVRGYESVFFPEHTHIPTSRRTPFIAGGDLPEMYWRTQDQFVALGMVAAVTENLKLGTGITLVTEHDPINTAKRVASLDALSKGRLLFGIGAGWNAEEMEDHGVPFGDRWKVTRERVLAMREIWSEDEPEYHGKFVDFPPMWSWPKPAQAGGPPVIMGAWSKYVPKPASPSTATAGCPSRGYAISRPGYATSARRWTMWGGATTTSTSPCSRHRAPIAGRTWGASRPALRPG